MRSVVSFVHMTRHLVTAVADMLAPRAHREVPSCHQSQLLAISNHSLVKISIPVDLLFHFQEHVWFLSSHFYEA